MVRILHFSPLIKHQTSESELMAGQGDEISIGCDLNCFLHLHKHVQCEYNASSQATLVKMHACYPYGIAHINALVQDCRNSIANTLELLSSCTKPPIYAQHMKEPTLQWRHNGHDGVSNHQPHQCLLNRFFGRRSKKTSKLRVTGLCVGNSPETGEFLAQMASNAENVSIWWCHHVLPLFLFNIYAP